MTLMAHARTAAPLLSSQRFLAALQSGIVLAMLIYPQFADAYMGQQFLTAITSTYLVPIAFFVLVGAGVSYWLAPQHGGSILKILIGIVTVLALIKGGNMIVGQLANVSETN